MEYEKDSVQKEPASFEGINKKEKLRDSNRFPKEGYPVACISIFFYYLIKE